MITKLLLPLAIACPIFTSCGESTDAAAKAGDAASAVADKAKDAFGDLANFDLKGVSVDGAKEWAGKATASMAEKLGGIKDAASAASFAKMAGPVMEKLGSAKDMIGGALPGADALTGALDKLKGAFAADSAVMKALAPIMEKMKGLLG